MYSGECITNTIGSWKNNTILLDIMTSCLDERDSSGLPASSTSPLDSSFVVSCCFVPDCYSVLVLVPCAVSCVVEKLDARRLQFRTVWRHFGATRVRAFRGTVPVTQIHEEADDEPHRYPDHETDADPRGSIPAQSEGPEILLGESPVPDYSTRPRLIQSRHCCCWRRLDFRTIEWWSYMHVEGTLGASWLWVRSLRK